MMMNECYNDNDDSDDSDVVDDDDYDDYDDYVVSNDNCIYCIV